MMKKRSFLIVLFVSCLFFLVSAFAGDNLDKIWDFGKIKQGNPIAHTFVYKNDTKALLKIKSSHASCGCTVAKIQKDALLAGESTDVVVTFNPKGYHGEVTQFVYIETDNAENPVIKYNVKVNVEGK